MFLHPSTVCGDKCPNAHNVDTIVRELRCYGSTLQCTSIAKQPTIRSQEQVLSKPNNFVYMSKALELDKIVIQQLSKYADFKVRELQLNHRPSPYAM